MIIAHPFAGVCITHFVASQWKKLNTKQQTLIWITGITASVLPDFDLILTPFFPNIPHHLFITHTPMFYLIIGLFLASVLLYLEKVKKQNVLFLEKLLIVWLVNVLIHILLDAIAGNIQLLWGADLATYNLFPIPSTNWINNYLRSPAILAEVVSIFFGSISLFIIRKEKYFMAALTSLILWFTIAIFMTFTLIL